MSHRQADQIIYACYYYELYLCYLTFADIQCMKTEIYTPFAWRIYKTAFKDSVRRELHRGKLVFFAGSTGHPYFSTDTATVLRAAEIEADGFFWLRQLMVSDSDPKVNRRCKR